MIISVSAEKNFIIAKAFVRTDVLKDSNIDIRAGYNIYSSYNGAKLEEVCVANELGSMVSLEQFGQKKEGLKQKLINIVAKTKQDYVTLYWIKSNKEGKALIKVPFGFSSSEGQVKSSVELRGHGCVEFEIKSIEKFLSTFPIINWETVYDKGITYQYLTEYFIDSEKKQNGFSIVMRDFIKPVIAESLGENKIKEEVKKTVLSNINNKLAIYGLEAVSVNYEQFADKQEVKN